MVVRMDVLRSRQGSGLDILFFVGYVVDSDD